MDKKIMDRIQELAKKMAVDFGYELVDAELLGRGRRTLLRITIDKEGGISLEDCSMFSRRLDSLIDVEDPFSGPYTLEVSSPGLDRPLKTPADFRKNTGKPVRIVTKEKINNQNFFVGRLEQVFDDSIVISVHRKGDSDLHLEIPVEKISRANMEILTGNTGKAKDLSGCGQG